MDRNRIICEKERKWLKQYLELLNGIPSLDTIQRVISILNPNTLYSDIINYLINKINQICKGKTKDILSIDVKTSNGSSISTGINKNGEVVNTMRFIQIIMVFLLYKIT